MPKTHTSGKHFKQLIESSKARALPYEQIFRKDSTYGRKHLKRRVLADNLLEYKCQSCGLGPEWNNKPLVLHLDHINGDSFDNRLENLRFLCPNCHTQEPTYSRGQTTKKNKDRYKELRESQFGVKEAR